MSAERISVLYLDDDAAFVRLVQKVLGRRNLDVTHAASIERAEDLLNTTAFDVIALDHYLEGGTGLDYLPRLAARQETLPVIYVTGSSEIRVALDALKAGAADFVPKTVGEDFLDLLAAALWQAVEQARLRVAKEKAEAEVRAARDRAELLLAEVNHRVANSLSLVASFVRLQANAVDDRAAKDALTETESRVFAIALVHKHLYSAGDAQTVALRDYFGGILGHLQPTTGGTGKGPLIQSDLADLSVPTDAAVKLGLVLTEWVTNAIKYAYPEGTGDIRVRVQTLSDQEFELAVEDDGVGLLSNAPAKGTGLGTRLVSAMAAGLRGQVEYVSGGPGTRARLVIPLER